MTRSRRIELRFALLVVLWAGLGISGYACAQAADGGATGAQAARDHAASPSGPAASASGRRVYERWCAPCHAPGPGHPGTQSLQVKYGGKTPAVLLERTDLTSESVAFFVRHGVLSMPPFRKTEITDTELAALADFVARRHSAR